MSCSTGCSPGAWWLPRAASTAEPTAARVGDAGELDEPHAAGEALQNLRRHCEREHASCRRRPIRSG